MVITTTVYSHLKVFLLHFIKYISHFLIIIFDEKSFQSNDFLPKICHENEKEDNFKIQSSHIFNFKMTIFRITKSFRVENNQYHCLADNYIRKESMI